MKSQESFCRFQNLYIMYFLSGVYNPSVFLLSLELYQKVAQRRQCKAEVYTREVARCRISLETHNKNYRMYHMQNALTIYLGCHQSQPSSLDSMLSLRVHISILTITTSLWESFVPWPRLPRSVVNC